MMPAMRGQGICERIHVQKGAQAWYFCTMVSVWS